MEQQQPIPAEKTHWARALAVSFGILALSGVMAVSGNLFIQARYPDRPRPDDLLFDLLPSWDVMRHATDVVFIAGIVLLALYAFRGHTREIPAIVTQFGLMEGTRALIMILTPLATPFDEPLLPTVLGLRNYGEFPSGHAATVLLFYLVVDRETAPGIKRAMGWLVFAEIVTLLLSEAHYSIGVVGGLLVAYFINHAWTCGHVFDRLKPLVSVE